MRGSTCLARDIMSLRLVGNGRGVCTNFRRHTLHLQGCLKAKSKSEGEVKPKIPLYERPPCFSTSLSELTKWHRWATNLISSVGSSFVLLDNGPDSNLLRRELKWFLQDLLQVHHHSLIPSLTLLESESDMLDISVALRAPLEELYSAWTQRIQERKPFQYIVGCEHWRDLVLSVQEGVLIPRPETELIIDLVKDVALSQSPELGKGIWADLGTGTGAIAIALANTLATSGHGHGHGRVIATDISSVAVAVASSNVQRYGLQDVIEVRKGYWFDPLQDVQGKLAGILSNPPYIPSVDIFQLQAEVGRHEPKLALDGGISGTEYLLHLIHGAASMLQPGGFFAFETNGEKQSKFLANNIQRYKPGSFCNVSIVSDFAGIPRFVMGFRHWQSTNASVS